MRLTIRPSRLSGTASAPASKSMAHRLLLCAGLSEGVSVIHNADFSEDILATIACLRALGVDVSVEGSRVTVYGKRLFDLAPRDALPCHESGSTLRFLIPICLFCGKPAVLTGTEKLLSRPLSVYESLCAAQNIGFVREKTALRLSGRLSGGHFALAGNISSQFITGMLLALGGCGGGTLELVGSVESRPYIDMTLSAMRAFGVNARWQEERALTVPPQRYVAGEAVVEGDYSGAAFLEALNLMGHDVKVVGLRPDSLQGDRVYQALLPRLAEHRETVSLADCPDLAPILMTVAASRHGAVFTDTARLRLKESDRGHAMAEELRKFGADIAVEENRISVAPAPLHPPAETLSAHNDHRVAMALSVLMTRYGGTLDGAESVRKSFPAFFDILKSLGADIT